MKTKLICATFAVGLALTTGCSIFGKKHDEPTKGDNTVVDAGMSSTDPAKLDGNALDVGAYKNGEDYADVASHGGRNGAVIPTEKFYSTDREKYAPLGKMLYVLTDESPSRCFMAKYINLEGHKKLVVYSKSQVPTNYCIYQKTYSSEPEGFSIYLEKGGICKPSYTVIETDKNQRKVASVEDIDKTVSMNYCVDNTVSYGQELARKQN